MNEGKTIPIVIGVTGHREIAEQDRAAILTSVTAELKKLQELCPHSELVMLSSLAEGGDLLCADVAEALGIPLIAILPREQQDYEKDFTETGAKKLSHHIVHARRVLIVPRSEPLPQKGPTRNWQFRQAGIYIGTRCHVLLALWDGGPGTEAACGTAETIGFALGGGYEQEKSIVSNSEKPGVVIHIFTPRHGRNESPAGAVHYLGNETAAKEMLRKIDELNASAARNTDDHSSDQTVI